jgi:hypothetical protein
MYAGTGIAYPLATEFTSADGYVGNRINDGACSVQRNAWFGSEWRSFARAGINDVPGGGPVKPFTRGYQ